MKTARGVEGEGFANFVHVVLYCKLFFLQSGQLWKIQTITKETILYIGNLLAMRSLQHRQVNTDIFLRQGGWGIRFSGRKKTQLQCISQPIRSGQERILGTRFWISKQILNTSLPISCYTYTICQCVLSIYNVKERINIFNHSQEIPVMKNIIFSHPIHFTHDTSILSFSIKVPETKNCKVLFSNTIIEAAKSIIKICL